MLCTVWDSSRTVGLLLLLFPSHTQVPRQHFFFLFSLHSEDSAAPLLWRNIFFNTSAVMLTSAASCQHDSLLRDTGGMPLRLTVWQVCRKERSPADHRNKSSLSLSLPPCLHLSLIEAAKEHAAFEYFSEGSHDVWCADLYANEVEDTDPGNPLFFTHFPFNKSNWTLRSPSETPWSAEWRVKLLSRPHTAACVCVCEWETVRLSMCIICECVVQMHPQE